MREPIRAMLRCSDHGLAPGGVICAHPARRPATVWVPAAEVYHGAGPECAKRANELTADDLLTACLHRVRALRGPGPDDFPP
jgi:hypothetical protein